MKFSSHLSVPGLLEYESIPAVSSSKPFGRTNMRQRGRSKTEDITVKTITKYVSFPCPFRFCRTFTNMSRLLERFSSSFTVILRAGNIKYALYGSRYHQTSFQTGAETLVLDFVLSHISSQPYKVDF